MRVLTITLDEETSPMNVEILRSSTNVLSPTRSKETELYKQCPVQ